MRRFVDVITMGCSKNLVDSERLLYQLHVGGFRVFHNPKKVHHDVVIVNTCGFINDAKEESINMILGLCRQKQEGRINALYVTGCLSERFMDDLLKEVPEVDKYYGKFDYGRLLNDLGLKCGANYATHRLQTTPRHYAYVKISEGCDRGCAYCSIPLITGKHQSRRMEEIVEEVKVLSENKVRELQVVAQELTYYGIDLYEKRMIAELVEKISAVKGIKWIRLHYGYPSGFPDDLIRVMSKRPNVCKYMDIALQHASDKILKSMRRHTTKEEQMHLIKKLREEVPGIALRTTMMVGYPGEGDAEFEELIDFVKWARFEHLGAFIYSEEEGTWAAANLRDSVPMEVKRARFERLMEVQQGISREIGEGRRGKVLPVVIDRRENEYYVGRTEYDSPEVDGEVYVSAGPDHLLRRGEFYNVKITGSDEYDLYGDCMEHIPNE